MLAGPAEPGCSLVTSYVATQGKLGSQQPLQDLLENTADNYSKRNSSQVEEHADRRVEQEGLILVQDVLRTQQLHLVHHRDAADGEQTLQ